MNTERLWEIPLRNIAKVSEDLLTLEQLNRVSPTARTVFFRCFWGYHTLVAALLLLEGPLGLALGLARPAGYLLLPFWAVYAFNVIAIYLPSNGIYSLYGFLRSKDTAPSHAILISAFAVLGVISLVLYVAR
jgi:hypothetical protein